MRVENLCYSITLPDEVTSEEELQRELCDLFDSAHRNGVATGSISTWVCRHEHVPDKELVVTELTKR